VALDRSGFCLTPSGQTTRQLDQAWLSLDSDAAALRLQHLGIDLNRWRLAPVICRADPAHFPRRWRVTLE